jgi:hypothetical protein
MCWKSIQRLKVWKPTFTNILNVVKLKGKLNLRMKEHLKVMKIIAEVEIYM